MKPTSASKRWKKSDGVWLLLALFVHASLLLIPLQRPRLAANVNSTLAVRLLPIAHVAFRHDGAEAEFAPVPAQVPARESPQIATAGPRPEIPPPHHPVDEKPAFRALTTAGLLDTARTMRLDRVRAGGARPLGVHVHQDLPPNWRPGAGARALQAGDGLFTGMGVPAEVEIVDRWLAADGSHNVVLNLPNGQTVCGRAEAWNPLQALVEHVMMFRTCGGGGERTFEMSTGKVAAGGKPDWTDAAD